MPHRATWGSLSMVSGQIAGVGWGEAGARTFTGMSVGQARQGRINTVGLANLSNFSRL